MYGSCCLLRVANTCNKQSEVVHCRGCTFTYSTMCIYSTSLISNIGRTK